jgi:hypothetical protein
MAISLTRVQKAADIICDKHEVPRIKIIGSNRRGSKGDAAYVTYRIRNKITGKISPKSYPKYIVIYEWSGLSGLNDASELSYPLGHELAHHILNIKRGNIRHTANFYTLANKLDKQLSRLI